MPHPEHRKYYVYRAFFGLMLIVFLVACQEEAEPAADAPGLPTITVLAVEPTVSESTAVADSSLDTENSGTRRVNPSENTPQLPQSEQLPIIETPPEIVAIEPTIENQRLTFQLPNRPPEEAIVVTWRHDDESDQTIWINLSTQRGSEPITGLCRFQFLGVGGVVLDGSGAINRCEIIGPGTPGIEVDLMYFQGSDGMLSQAELVLLQITDNGNWILADSLDLTRLFKNE